MIISYYNDLVCWQINLLTYTHSRDLRFYTLSLYARTLLYPNVKPLCIFTHPHIDNFKFYTHNHANAERRTERKKMLKIGKIVKFCWNEIFKINLPITRNVRALSNFREQYEIGIVRHFAKFPIKTFDSVAVKSTHTIIFLFYLRKNNRSWMKMRRKSTFSIWILLLINWFLG